jgi:hypothetical protein
MHVHVKETFSLSRFEGRNPAVWFGNRDAGAV